MPDKTVETRERLLEVLKAATDYAVAEARVERLAAELKEHEDDWTEDLDQFSSAVHYEIRAALSWDEDDRDGLQVCQDIQDAIDVLDFAMSRTERKDEVTADAR